MRLRRLRVRNGYAVVYDRLPSQQDLDWIAARKLGIHIESLPEGNHDLEFLLPLASVLEKLIVTDFSCTDARAVARLGKLRSLQLWISPRYSVELHHLLRLEAAALTWSRYLSSVTGCATLRELTIEKPPPNIEAQFERLEQLESLRLASLGSVSAVPAWNGARHSLAHLDIQFARKLDVSPAASLLSLTQLELEKVDSTEGFAALATCRALRRVVLEDCRSIDEVQALADLPALSELLIIGTTRFPAGLEALLRERGVKMHLPPRPRRR